MHKVYYDLTNDVINRVYVQFCSGTPFEEIMKRNCLSRFEVLAILRQKDISKEYIYENLGPQIDTEKILIISDTHIGSELENLDYIKDAYEFARLNGITHVFHGGDLLHSDLEGVRSDMRKPTKQIEYALANYPEIDNITTHILLGNHDFNLFVRTYTDDKLLNMLKERKDFDILGFKKAYLKWYKTLVSIRHSMPKYDINARDIKSNFSFQGHKHMFKQNHPVAPDFSLPALSDDYDTSTYSKNEPGFVVLERKGKTYLVSYYSFDMKNNFPEFKDIEISDRRIINHGYAYQASMEKKLRK